MAHAAPGAQVHQPLDVHRHLAAQVAFNRELGELRADRRHFGFGQILDAGGGIDAGRRADILRAIAAHAEDVGQTDDHMLVHRNVDTGYACHVATSTLTLLVTRIAADHVDDAAPAHDLAVLADFLHRR